MLHEQTVGKRKYSKTFQLSFNIIFKFSSIGPSSTLGVIFIDLDRGIIKTHPTTNKPQIRCDSK